MSISLSFKKGRGRWKIHLDVACPRWKKPAATWPLPSCHGPVAEKFIDAVVKCSSGEKSHETNQAF